jgi:hypothetical protein
VQLDVDGDGISIAVIDSLLAPAPGELDFDIDIADTVDFAKRPVEERPGHGLWVTNMLAAFAPAATYYLYRIGCNDDVLGSPSLDGADDASGDPTRSPVTTADFVRTLTRAVEDDVNILNVSGGWDHDHSREGCVVEGALRRLGTNAPLVIAAAGNRSSWRGYKEQVNCPGRIALDCTIAVAGFKTLCPAAPHTDVSAGNLWIDHSVVPPDPDDITETYCSFRGCGSPYSCMNDRQEVIWEHNVSPVGNKPDVYAPVQYIHDFSDHRACLIPGTSFGTPIVTGMLATILSNLNTKVPNDSIHAAVHSGAVRLRNDHSDGTLERTMQWFASGRLPTRFSMAQTWDTLNTASTQPNTDE